MQDKMLQRSIDEGDTLLMLGREREKPGSGGWSWVTPQRTQGVLWKTMASKAGERRSDGVVQAHG
jgi:hypothetical protein